MIENFKTFVYGIILGIANVLPGVSGGTMAVILNIYDKILFAISLKNIRNNLKFLAMLFIGTVVGIYIFSKLMILVFYNHEDLLNYCFIGMILGSIPMIYKKARFEKVKTRNLFFFVITFAFMILLVFLGQGEISNKTISDLGGVNLLVVIWLVVSSAISAMAMILPGVSGSFVMLLLGTYTMTLEAVSDFNFAILIPVAAGVGFGCFFGIKFMKIMLRFHPQALYFGILGLVIGSIFIIIPSPPVGTEGIISVCLALFFTVVTYWFSKKA